ncbi:SDR family oxidoreductase [Granulicoccus phenolivorans]|uniref:SDR family oxidoreductase n=1 Tax=Granulicoccus phenolivorans TaxID=266854 RepID=UPI0003FBD09A|nr:SDR family oxidoreductase [Granulicoccus phenolivorans]
MNTKSSHRGLDLHGTRVLITGGGSGIGRRMALEAARRGAGEVILWDLSGEAAEAVAAEIRAIGGTASVQVVNVADRAAVAEAAKAIGGIDVLINNAGVVTGADLLDASEEAIIRTFEVNTLALYWTARAFLPGMQERDRGTIVNIASAAGIVGVAKQTDYSASKFAAFGFTESLRGELRARGSHVNTLLVAPYYINTGMFAGVRTKFPKLLPILDEQDVAERIIDAIEAGKQELIMPPLVGVMPLVRVLPVRLFDRVVDFFGVNRTMDHFTGRG